MGIALTDDHRELGGVVRAFLVSHKARWAARELLDAAEERRPPFWTELAGLGWLGLHISEEYGGSGYGLPELVVVVEELGRAIAPGPFVPTVIASAVLAARGTDEQKARLLPGLVDGSVTAGIGFGGDVTVHADGRANGAAGVVLGAGTADLLLLVAGDDLLLVPSAAEGVSVTVPANLDPTRRSGRVALRDATIRPADILPAARTAALARARTILAAEAVGGASDCVETAVEYAKARKQFGRTIATFQAIKHHCANMLMAAESAVATVWDAARAAEADEPTFELNGQKVWTSGAHYASRGLATVRTDPEVPKHAGITTVIIDMKAPGVEVRPLRMLIGGAEFNEVFFTDVFVPDEDVVGAPGAGWAVARATLGNERVSIGGGSAAGGFADTALIPLVAEHPDRLTGAEIRVGRFLADDHSLRLLNLRRAVRSIEGAGPGPEGNITKLKLAGHVDEQMAIMAALTGPDLALAEGPAAFAGLMVLGARAMGIAGGTSEVTRNQIAERILGMPRDPLID